MKKILLSLIVIIMVVLSGCAALKDQLGGGLGACPPGLDEAGALTSEVTGDAAVDTEETADETKDSEEETEENAEEESAELEGEEAMEKSPEPTRMTFELSEEESALPRKELRAGELVSFPNLKAEDPDGDVLTYTFSEPLNEKGEWQTAEGDEGKYTVTVTVSDGVNFVEQTVLLLVEPGNYPPHIKLLSEIEIKEGDTLVLKPEVSDLDDDEVTLTFSGWTEKNIRKAGFDDAGEHIVTVTANDGTISVTKDIKVIVANVNRAPQVERLDSFEIVEEDKFKLSPITSDADGDELTLTFDEPLDENGEWTPQIGDAGNYKLKVVVSDGDLSTEESFFVIVEALNLPPVLKLSDVTVEEGENVTLKPEVSDPEGEEVSVTYSGWMTSDTKETGFEDAGAYTVIVKASDGQRETEKEITVTVTDKNRPPVFDASAFN